MPASKKLSMDEWREIGLLFKDAQQKLDQVSTLMKGRVSAKTIKLVSRLSQAQMGEVKSNLEDAMFQQHPGETGDRLSVFYGGQQEILTQGNHEH